MLASARAYLGANEDNARLSRNRASAPEDPSRLARAASDPQPCIDCASPLSTVPRRREGQADRKRRRSALKDWCGGDVLGEWSLPGCTVTLGVPKLSPRDAAARGAGSIVVGIAPTGGQLPPHWVAELIAAAEAGLDVVSGLHTRLTSLPDLVAAAERRGVRLIDVRHSDRRFGAATGRKRSGKRVLTVGTDWRARQEVHGACDRREPRAARRESDVPGHRPDRHHDLGSGHRDGRGHRRLRGRRGRGALAGQRARPLGL